MILEEKRVKKVSTFLFLCNIFSSFNNSKNDASKFIRKRKVQSKLIPWEQLNDVVGPILWGGVFPYFHISKFDDSVSFLVMFLRPFLLAPHKAGNWSMAMLFIWKISHFFITVQMSRTQEKSLGIISQILFCCISWSVVISFVKRLIV